MKPKIFWSLHFNTAQKTEGVYEHCWHAHSCFTYKSYILSAVRHQC